jgi:HAE1 family hydrophobic/amphiphilic exporter-1
LGTAVLGGMLVSTVLNLIFVPVLYVMTASLRERVNKGRVISEHGAALVKEGLL